jgi:hypothetical protein
MLLLQQVWRVALQQKKVADRIWYSWRPAATPLLLTALLILASDSAMVLCCCCCHYCC